MYFYKRLLGLVLIKMILDIHLNHFLSIVPGNARNGFFSQVTEWVKDRLNWFVLFPRLCKGSSFSVASSPCVGAGRGREACLLSGEWRVRHEGLGRKLVFPPDASLVVAFRSWRMCEEPGLNKYTFLVIVIWISSFLYFSGMYVWLEVYFYFIFLSFCWAKSHNKMFECIWKIFLLSI